VDECFRDLCRQLLRLDDLWARQQEHDDYYAKAEDGQGLGQGRKKKGRWKSGKKDHKCVIL
jgi:hypothetical protein